MVQCATALMVVWGLQSEIVTSQVNPKCSVDSWRSVGNDIFSVLSGGHHTHNDMMKSAEYRRLDGCRDERLYFEMIQCSRDPFVVLAGFNLVRQHFPQRAPAAAILAVLSVDKRGLIQTVGLPARQFLAGCSDYGVLSQELAQMESCCNVGFLQVGWILSSVSPQMLWRWYSDPGRKELIPSYEAVLIDVLMDVTDVLPTGARDRLDQSVARLADFPGWPRMVFVMYGNQSNPKFRIAVINVLEDVEPVPDEMIFPVLRPIASYLSAHIDIESIKISPERRQLIRKYISRTESRPTSAPDQPPP